MIPLIHHGFVIGSNNLFASNALKKIYKKFNIPILIMNREDSEMVKFVANSYLAMRLSFINEISNLCEKLDLNIDKDSEDIFLKLDNKFIKICCILNLFSVSDNGTCRFDVVDDMYHRSKTMFKYFTWHADIPLFTENVILDIDRKKIKQWLLELKIPLYNVRGDIEKIILKIKEKEI